MKKNITLTMDKSVVEMAKKYAKEKGVSLSSLAENYLKCVVGNRLKNNNVPD